jgi:hypothetical protein
VASGVALGRSPNREALEGNMNSVGPTVTRALEMMQVIAGAETTLHLKRVRLGVKSMTGAVGG